MASTRRLPAIIAHVDWSINPKKRWFVSATLENGNYRLKAARPFDGLMGLENLAGTLLGVDFPIGLPLAYARAIGVESFCEFVESIQNGEREAFFEVADSAEKISLNRPFYPKRPGGTNQQQLLDGLGFRSKYDLSRWCDRATKKRRAGANMFWTMGANQTGKGMLSGLRELLLPNWELTARWPFDGRLNVLLEQPQLIFAEAYPGEFYHQLGLFVQRGSKRNRAVRIREGKQLLLWADDRELELSAELRRQITTGFGSKPDGEDPFDSVVGLFGMLNVILGNRVDMPQLPEEVRQIEGWVLGQSEYPIGFEGL